MTVNKYASRVDWAVWKGRLEITAELIWCTPLTPLTPPQQCSRDVTALFALWLQATETQTLLRAVLLLICVCVLGASRRWWPSEIRPDPSSFFSCQFLSFPQAWVAFILRTFIAMNFGKLSSGGWVCADSDEFSVTWITARPSVACRHALL